MSVFQATFIECHCVYPWEKSRWGQVDPVLCELPATLHLLLAIPAMKRDPAPTQALPYPSWFFSWFCSILREAWSCRPLAPFFSLWSLAPNKGSFLCGCFYFAFCCILTSVSPVPCHFASCFWSLSGASQMLSWCHSRKGWFGALSRTWRAAVRTSGCAWALGGEGHSHIQTLPCQLCDLGQDAYLSEARSSC